MPQLFGESVSFHLDMSPQLMTAKRARYDDAEI